MCKYCKLDEKGRSDTTAWCMVNSRINDVTIVDCTFFADTGYIHISSDLIPHEEKIKIKYCPMCGRNVD